MEILNDRCNDPDKTILIKVENLSYTYQQGTPFEFKALEDINISICKGDMVGIIGPTGSGKSTLIQHLNGLLRPTSGRVIVKGQDINAKQKNEPGRKKRGAPPRRSICSDVGLVFQYPEYQLFEETVYDDIAFGPKNLDLSPEEIDNRVRESMEWMGLDVESFRDRSPFSLSGGEMRRVALAGVLAMKPEILVLDEPAAGMDPKGRKELYEQVIRLHNENGMTMVMVSHQMGDAAQTAGHLIVIDRGRIVADGTPSQVFENREKIKSLGLGIPPCMELMDRLLEKGIPVDNSIVDINGAEQQLLKLLQ